MEVSSREEHFEKEKEYILATAKVNGYKRKTGKHLMRRKERQLRSTTTQWTEIDSLASTQGQHVTLEN